jgi:hypothetical protein
MLLFGAAIAEYLPTLCQNIAAGANAAMAHHLYKTLAERLKPYKNTA